MKTWDKETADKWIAEMEEHQRLDEYAQGDWFDTDTRVGCFYGCNMQTSERALEKAIVSMKLPPWLVYLSEKIFEGLPSEEAKTFPVRLIKAIPINTDIESVRHKLAISRLSKLKDNCNNDEVNSAIDMVISCHRSPLNSDWSAAESAAWSAAESAAWSAAESAAWSAAESAAKSAAKSAAWSAESAAEPAAWSAESNLLIKLLSEMKD